MPRPSLLDLFCCEGGAGAGYDRAGFRVVGVDIADHSDRYPFRFFQRDALDVLREMVEDGGGRFTLKGQGPGGTRLRFDAIHASPPCQAYTRAKVLQKNTHPEMVDEVRELLERTGLPYVIENVQGAPLRHPVQLCGTALALPFMRHRWFETNFALSAPKCQHGLLKPLPEWVFHNRKADSERGQRMVRGMRIFGANARADLARKAMEMPWASRDGVAEAIPPAFTHHIGAFLSAEVDRRLQTARALEGEAHEAQESDVLAG